MRGSLGSKLTTLLGGGLVSKLLGAVREIVLAYAFGATYVADAFRVAMTALLLPTHFFTGEALFGAFIPAYRSESGERRVRLVRSVSTLLGGVMLVVAVILVIAAPVFVSVLAPGFEVRTSELTAGMIRVGSAGVILYAISALLISLQVADGDYLPYTGRPMAQNLAVLAATVAAATLNAPLLLATGFVAAYAFMAAWTLSRSRRSGLLVSRALRPTRRPGGAHLRGFGQAVGHLSVFVVLTQASIVVDRLVATLTGTGGVAALDYALFVSDSMRMLAAVPIATLALGQLGGLNWERARRSVEPAITVLLYGSVLVSIFLWGTAEEIVTVLYERGAFDRTATHLTTGALRGFAIGAWAATTGYVYLRVFNAVMRNREVVVAGAASLLVNVMLDLTLYGPLGVFGVALATSVSATVFLVLLVWRSGTAAPLLRRTGPPVLLLAPLVVLLPRVPFEGVSTLAAGMAVTGLYGLLALQAWSPLRADLRWVMGRLRRRDAGVTGKGDE